MKVDAEDFRRVYEGMNDAALLQVKREDLVEVAQQCYDVELDRRGLTVGGEAAAQDAASSEAAAESEGMVELALFTDVDEARIARALLKGAEIPAYLENTDPMGRGEFRLSVPPEWLEEAREILEAEISEEELAAQAEAAELEEEAEEFHEPE